jgi:hypothetical protein
MEPAHPDPGQKPQKKSTGQSVDWCRPVEPEKNSLGGLVLGRHLTSLSDMPKRECGNGSPADIAARAANRPRYPL